MIRNVISWWRHQMETFSAHYWTFERGIHRWPVNSPHKGQRRGALLFSLISACMNGWLNNREAGDLGRHRAHYDVTVMSNKNIIVKIKRWVVWKALIKELPENTAPGLATFVNTRRRKSFIFLVLAIPSTHNSKLFYQIIHRENRDDCMNPLATQWSVCPTGEEVFVCVVKAWYPIQCIQWVALTLLYWGFDIIFCELGLSIYPYLSTLIQWHLSNGMTALGPVK